MRKRLHCPGESRLPKKGQIGSNRREGAVPSAALVDGTTPSAQVAGMAEGCPSSRFPSTPVAAGAMPGVHLELRQGNLPPTAYQIFEGGFLIGTVPGCDIRIPGTGLPPVLCLIGHGPTGLTLRKLAAGQPILVNRQLVSSVGLGDGDRVTVGAVELIVRAPANTAAKEDHGDQPVAVREPPQELEKQAQQLAAREKDLEEQTRQLETDRVIWYRRREEIEQECRQLQIQAAGPKGADLAQQRDHQAKQLSEQQMELEAIRQELADVRRQLYERYRVRRDRLAGLQEAVNRAATKVQERKRALDAEVHQAAVQRQEDEARRADLHAKTEELDKTRRLVEEERDRLQRLQQEQEQAHADLLAQCQARETDATEKRQVLEKDQAQFRNDLVRLDRLREALEKRQQELQDRTQEISRRAEQLQLESRDLDEQARELNDWEAKLESEAGRHAEENAKLEQRAAGLDEQQVMLTALRSRLEQTKEELRQQEQQLVGQRARQEETEAELKRRHQVTLKLRVELDQRRSQLEEDSRLIEARRSTLETELAEVRQGREQQAVREDHLRLREVAVETRAAEQAEAVSVLRARSEQVLEVQQRLAADRQSLRERELAISRAEQTREALQEQLRRRAEELAARQRALTEQASLHAETIGLLETRRAEIEQERQQLQTKMEQERQQAETLLATQRQDLAGQAADLERRQANLVQREETWQRHVERVRAIGRRIAAMRKALAQQRTQWQGEKNLAARDVAEARVELEVLRQEILRLGQQIPEWELRAQAAIQRLVGAREQLRGHLAELHAYARQGREDIETLRSQVAAEADQVRQFGLSLHRARDEHRHAVAAFRQQLIEWQGEVAEMKRTLAHDETRLERRQAQVDEAARQVDAGQTRLAQQAEELHQQERVVAERRDEMERHLSDMREWYRRKLRELAGSEGAGAKSRSPEAPESESTLADSPPSPSTPDRDILTLTGDIDPGDRPLGDLLQRLGLVDADTLAALLVETRKQRRSLRQLLLASGHVTLYQMAMIEAGNLDGLMLGPVRVVDRLRSSSREMVYRVFDPRRGQEAVLRQLTESEAQNAVRPDEFRQRFAAAAAVRHAHLAATLEVLDIGGRPAVLQERVTGLPATDWPALVGVPGVWFRLLSQAALGLHTAHQAGLVHGHLHAALLLLTGEGVLKICGFGEPPWLVDLPSAEVEDAQTEVGNEVPTGPEANAASDLAALGQIAGTWIAAGPRRKGGKSKGQNEPWQPILQRLLAGSADHLYPDAATLLQDLDRVSAEIPPNGEAWERLLRQVREQGIDEMAIRRSA